MERLTTLISGYFHGKEGKSVDEAKKATNYCRGKFEATGIVERLAEYEDIGLTPDEIESKLEELSIKQSEELENALAVDQTVWIILEKAYKVFEIEKGYVVSIKSISTNREDVLTIISCFIDCFEFQNTLEFRINDIGKIIFKSKEEAEDYRSKIWND